MLVHSRLARNPSYGLCAALVFVAASSPSLRAQSLRIAGAAVSRSEDGPPVAKGAFFQPGEFVFFSFQVDNYKVGPTGKVQLTAHIQAFDPKEIALSPVDEAAIGTTLSAEDKDWKPKVRSQIPLPSIAPPGNYKIRYDVADLQSRQNAQGELTFTVGGRGVESANGLVIRNLGLYHAQDDEKPLQIAAYRAGDMVWVRFDITGYKYGPENSIDVTYDVAVLAPGGKQLFSQENAAVEKSQAFYPQPWVPAIFNLSLQSTMLRGTYTLVITAHDASGGQTASARADFQVQ